MLRGNSAFRRLWASQFATVTMRFAHGLSLAGVTFLEEQTGSSGGIGLGLGAVIIRALRQGQQRAE